VAPGGASPVEPGRGEGARGRAEGQGGRRAEGHPRRQGRCAPAEDQLQQERTARQGAEGQLQQERAALADTRSALERERTAREAAQKALEERNVEFSKLEGERVVLSITSASQE
jgi:flagellar motility protein MotE (MotC chaperone)